MKLNVENMITDIVGENPTKQQVRECMTKLSTLDSLFSVKNNPEGCEVDIGKYCKDIDTVTYEKIKSIYNQYEDEKKWCDFDLNSFILGGPDTPVKLPTTDLYIPVLTGKRLEKCLAEMKENNGDKKTLEIEINGKIETINETITHNYLTTAISSDKWIKNKITMIKNFLISKFDGKEEEFKEWLSLDRILQIKFMVTDDYNLSKSLCPDIENEWSTYIPQEFYIQLAQNLTQMLYLLTRPINKDRCPEVFEARRFGDFDITSDNFGEFQVYYWAYYNLQNVYQPVAEVHVNNATNNNELTTTQRSTLILNNYGPTGLKVGDYVLFSGCNFSDFCNKGITTKNYYKLTDQNYATLRTHNVTRFDRSGFFIARIIAIRLNSPELGNSDGFIVLEVAWQSKDRAWTTSKVSIPINHLVPNFTCFQSQADIQNYIASTCYQNIQVTDNTYTKVEQCLSQLINVLRKTPVIVPLNMVIEFEHYENIALLPAANYEKSDEYTMFPRKNLYA